MAMCEASAGRDAESRYYSGQAQRLAIEMGLSQSSLDQSYGDDERVVRSVSFWGAFALDQIWSLVYQSPPQASFMSVLPLNPSINADLEASLWVPYTDDGAPFQRSCEQASNVRSVWRCFYELSELSHDSLYLLTSLSQPLTSHTLLDTYNKYLNWYDNAPEVLRLGSNFTPAVFFAHLYHHFAILLLFRPFIQLRIIGSKVCPQHVCLQAGNAILRLLKSYSQLYSLHQTPTFFPYFALGATIVCLVIGATGLEDGAASCDEDSETEVLVYSQSEVMQQGITVLSEMMACHPSARRATHALLYLAKKWNIEVNSGYQNRYTTTNCQGLESGGLDLFALDTTPDELIHGWAKFIVQPESKHTSEMRMVQQAAENFSNEAKRPFPLSDPSRLSMGPQLEAAGFALM